MLSPLIIKWQDEICTIISFFVTVRITRARVLRASQEAGKQARMLRSVIVNNRSMIYVKDLDGRYMMANPAFEAFFGVTESELLGQTDGYIDPLSAPRWKADDVRARDGLFQSEEVSNRNGDERIFESSKFPLIDGDGNLYATCGVSLDVTSSRLLAEATEPAEQMGIAAQLGELAHLRKIHLEISEEVTDNPAIAVGRVEWQGSG